ncbi:MAG: tRNA pseudouridine38-40 synthase [Pseudohongiellaceae bacterium]|jgi:tRNA pseudouridine38-40 synthase
MSEYADIKAGDHVAVALSYDGSAYHGWQSQLKPNMPTVQENLEQALGFVANQTIKVHCAGRTDSGVHASHQLVHFQSPVDRGEKAWVQGGNTRLSDGIAIHWAKPVEPTFHARFSATARRYRYVILNNPVKSAILSDGVTLQTRPLDVDIMHAEAQCLLGKLDFTSFRAVACQANTAIRNVHFINVTRSNDLVVIDIQANAFLYHMVRNIAGALMDVGTGKYPTGWLQEILMLKDRTKSSATASPKGLYLIDVIYPEAFGLPEVRPGPFFLTAALP